MARLDPNLPAKALDDTLRRVMTVELPSLIEEIYGITEGCHDRMEVKARKAFRKAEHNLSN